LDATLKNFGKVKEDILELFPFLSKRITFPSFGTIVTFSPKLKCSPSGAKTFTKASSNLLSHPMHIPESVIYI